MTEDTRVETATETDCPYCAERVSAKAKKCKHCGEILDVMMREIEAIKSSRKGDIIVTNSSSASTASSATATAPADQPYRYRGHRTRLAAILWCLFLGAFGAHKFYLGSPGWGLVYLLFCWTLIPAVISLLELIGLILLNDADFDRRYNY